MLVVSVEGCVGIIVGVVELFCGLLGFSGLIGDCVENVAYTEFPSIENALPPLKVAVSPVGRVPARPRIVSVCVSNRNGPAINLEPSVDADIIERNPLTLRLLRTTPEETSYTKRRVFESPMIRFPDAVVIRPARNPDGVGLGLIVGSPGAVVGGGVIGTGVVTPVTVLRR